MTTEERVLRLENAFATLSEMVAQEASRTDAVLQLLRHHDEAMKVEAARTDTLLELVRDHDARSETQMTWLNQLGSAQSQTEANLSALTVILQELGQAQTDLARAQARTDERLSKLSELVERHVADGHS